MGWYVAHLIICALNGFICAKNGFFIDTWQFWFWTLAIICSYNFGRYNYKELG